MIRFTLRQLTYFTTTAELGSIARAGRKLRVSAAAISAAIDALEDLSGCILFDRFPAQGMRLTAVGAQLDAEARTVLAAARNWEQSTRYLREEASGHVQLGTYHALAYVFGLPIVMRNRERWPKVRLELLQTNLLSLLQQLDHGDLDVMLVYDNRFDRTTRDVTDLGTVRAKVILAETHPLAQRRRLKLADLEGLPYVQLTDDTQGPTMLDSLRGLGLNPEVHFSSSSYELVRSAVGKGLGFTLSMIQPANPTTYHGDRLVAIPLDAPVQERRIVALCRKGRASEPLIQNVVSSCLHVLDTAMRL